MLRRNFKTQELQILLDLKLSVLFNRTVLADLSQDWEQLLERKTAKNYTRKLILMANIY